MKMPQMPYGIMDRIGENRINKDRIKIKIG